MATDRYRAIAALLDDPLNHAAVLREMFRRGKSQKNFVAPPIKVTSGVGAAGWAFPTLRHLVRHGVPDRYSDEKLSNVELLATVFCDGTKWNVLFQLEDDETELGPFSSDKEALKAASAWFESQGFVVLTAYPWDSEDEGKYPTTKLPLPD